MCGLATQMDIQVIGLNKFWRQRLTCRLFIPIEIKDRELHGKLVLAWEAIQRGYEVYIGDQREMSARCFELGVGIYHDKSLAQTKAKFFRNLKKIGVYNFCFMKRG